MKRTDIPPFFGCVLPSGVIRGRRNPLHFRLHERLRYARTSHGMTSTDLAQRAGVSLDTVLSIEDGRRAPLLSTVAAIAAPLSVAPGWLAYGDSSAGADYQGLAARLKQKRVEAQLTVAAVGKAAGVSGQAVAYLESGKTTSVATCEALAQALGVSPAWLAYGAGP